MTIAFWCVLAAIVLPYICFGIARNRGRGLQGNDFETTEILVSFQVASRGWPSVLGMLSLILSSHFLALRRP